MFTDVDFPGTTFVQLFGPTGADFGSLSVAPANHDVSFVGITFTTGEKIARVRITSTLPPGPGHHDLFPTLPSDPFYVQDVVAIDDLIYSEPLSSGTAIPALSPWMLALLAALLLGVGAFALRS